MRYILESLRQQENMAIHNVLLKDYKRTHKELKEKQSAKLFEQTDNIQAFARVTKSRGSKWKSTFQQGHSLGCFIDIEVSFDITVFEIITRAAEVRRFEDAAIKWMLSSRTVEAMVCGSKTKDKVTRGCPQGGILSPIQWRKVIDSFLVELSQSGIFP